MQAIHIHKWTSIDKTWLLLHAMKYPNITVTTSNDYIAEEAAKGKWFIYHTMHIITHKTVGQIKAGI